MTRWNIGLLFGTLWLKCQEIFDQKVGVQSMLTEIAIKCIITNTVAWCKIIYRKEISQGMNVIGFIYDNHIIIW